MESSNEAADSRRRSLSASPSTGTFALDALSGKDVKGRVGVEKLIASAGGSGSPTSLPFTPRNLSTDGLLLGRGSSPSPGKSPRGSAGDKQGVLEEVLRIVQGMDDKMDRLTARVDTVVITVDRLSKDAEVATRASSRRASADDPFDGTVDSNPNSRSTEGPRSVGMLGRPGATGKRRLTLQKVAQDMIAAGREAGDSKPVSPAPEGGGAG
eukprot:Hpha_TRINITY_DN6865_c0_g2::TRINITY_DN6865_c0_g2_i1::g.46241::m.46241